jgi:hypothetical protein
MYGGMELGPTLMFAWMAWRQVLNRSGWAIVLLIYASIVAFRLIGWIRRWPAQRVRFATRLLEIALLVSSSVLWFGYRLAAA